jgi:hypothetical protein
MSSSALAQIAKTTQREWPFFGILVGARGFEPPTSRSRTERSTRLSHAPTSKVIIGKLLSSVKHAKILSGSVSLKVSDKL